MEMENIWAGRLEEDFYASLEKHAFGTIQALELKKETMKKTKEEIWAEWLAKDLSYTEAALGAMEEYAQQERPSKDELISMVRGIEPNNFKMMEHWMIAGRGSYSDKDGWRWNNTILNLNEHELRTLYVFCKTCNDEYIATKSNS